MPQDFSGQNLRGRSFEGQNLVEADFSYADIRSCDFSRANLKGANFSHAKAGLQKHWVAALVAFSLLLSVASGFILLIGSSLLQFFSANNVINIIIISIFLYLFKIASHRGFTREHPSFLQRRRKSVRIGKTSVFTYR